MSTEVKNHNQTAYISETKPVFTEKIEQQQEKKWIFPAEITMLRK